MVMSQLPACSIPLGHVANCSVESLVFLEMCSERICLRSSLGLQENEWMTCKKV